MELPSIGKHCSDSTCSQLDFLPFSCQYCKQSFARTTGGWKVMSVRNETRPHSRTNGCPCPLCSKPVPVKKGEDPNLRMEQHISAGCPEPATTTSKPIYTNSCHFKACKNRSAIPIICQKCRLNYCLKHRLEGDHACASLQSTTTTQKKGNNGNNNPGTSNLNGTNGKNNNHANASGTGHHWSLKNANAARNARAAAAAQQRANASSSSSAGKKDKDKCVVS
ncbi:unnamed protein product [Mortierella alpina]